MSQFNLDLESIRNLADLLKETGLNEIEVAEGDKRIRCVRNNEPAVMLSAAPVASMAAAAAPASAAGEAAKPAVAGTPVPAPMVGTVYLAPEPGAAPFVKAGDKVKAGDTILIIEAMKVMNPIKAPVGGTILDVLVSDAQPVEFGETLMAIG